MTPINGSISWKVLGTGACGIVVLLAGAWAADLSGTVKSHDKIIASMSTTLEHMAKQIDQMHEIIYPGPFRGD